MDARFARMKPSDRVNLAVEMSSVVLTITLESILDRNPRISKARLIEEARKRIYSGLGTAENTNFRGVRQTRVSGLFLDPLALGIFQGVQHGQPTDPAEMTVVCGQDDS